MTDFRYFCSTCGRRYRRDEVRYLCPVCAKEYAPGMPLVGVLTVEFDYAAIRRSFRMSQPDWSLFSAVEEDFFPKYPVGNTPFFRPPGLAEATGFENLWIKNDGQNPSGSLKDRASFLVVAEANRLGEASIVTASTGNAASALAAVCAAAGRRAIIFVPDRAPRAKLVQMLRHGARVIPVNGSYDDAFRLSLDFTAKYGGLNRNTAYHPLTIEGKKTAGLEICQQNGWKAPDAVIVPVGDGVIIAGVSKAFGDLQAAGLISHVPRLIAVQAEKSAAIHNFVKTGVYSNAENPATIADSISVSVPSNARLARVAILESGGCSLTVTDKEILEGQRLLAEKAGIFAEPAASATAAALSKLRDGGILGRRDQVVLLVTGHGLKDVDAAMKCVRVPPAIDPTPEALEALAGKHASKGGGP